MPTQRTFKVTTDKQRVKRSLSRQQPNAVNRESSDLKHQRATNYQTMSSVLNEISPQNRCGVFQPIGQSQQRDIDFQNTADRVLMLNKQMAASSHNLYNSSQQPMGEGLLAQTSSVRVLTQEKSLVKLQKAYGRVTVLGKQTTAPAGTSSRRNIKISRHLVAGKSQPSQLVDNIQDEASKTGAQISHRNLQK